MSDQFIRRHLIAYGKIVKDSFTTAQFQAYMKERFRNVPSTRTISNILARSKEFTHLEKNTWVLVIE